MNTQTEAAGWWRKMLRGGGSRGPAPVGLVPAVVVGVVTTAAIVLATSSGLEPWVMIGGVAASGVVGVMAVMGFGRAMQDEYRGLAAIRRALRLASDDKAGGAEQSAMALGVGAHFGPEARAFQAILNERDELRKRAKLATAEDTMSRRGGASAGAGELGSVCDALWVGLMLIDAEFRVLYANGAAGVLLGCKRDELVRAGLLPSLNDDGVISLIRQVASGAVRTRQSVEIRRLPAPVSEPKVQEGDGRERRGRTSGGRGASLPDGTTVLRFTVRPLRREDGGAAMVVIEDVTQQRVADEARNRFVAHATHELRTPLTNIRLYVDELVEVGDTDAAARGKCLNVISAESRRLERIVSDMLSVSEIEAGSLRLRSGDVRPDALFDELEHDYRAAAVERKQTLRFDLPPKWPVMTGDRDKLALALHNLVGNALKYTPDGGSVTVKASEEPGRLVVSVTDTGIGIKDEEQELIFDRFYRSQDGRIAGITGSGLGLALAREVARLHGGDITVSSRINEGSTFTLWVPLGGMAGAERKAA